ncbi:MAG: hypothetical protein K6F94_00010 [Bacteroidaceae bacterium]|nr:hypothetical protein [Bacteroidaceae bacterium]
MKKTYKAPEVSITKLALETMIAVSDLGLSDTNADSEYGMEVKEDDGFWDDEW